MKTHGGKGDAPRPESAPRAFANGYDAIDWGARDREASVPASIGCPCDPSGSDGLACPDKCGSLLCVGPPA